MAGLNAPVNDDLSSPEQDGEENDDLSSLEQDGEENDDLSSPEQDGEENDDLSSLEQDGEENDDLSSPEQDGDENDDLSFPDASEFDEGVHEVITYSDGHTPCVLSAESEDVSDENNVDLVTSNTISSVNKAAGLFLLTLKEQHRLTQTSMDFALSQVKIMMGEVIQEVRSKVDSELQGHLAGTGVDIPDLGNCFHSKDLKRSTCRQNFTDNTLIYL